MISAIVCTRNRAGRLQQALESFATLSVPDKHVWELIIVDNNSNDGTEEVVRKFARFSGLDVRYVFEAKTGLSFARNRGVREANGEIIAFTDDDCQISPNWLQTIQKEFSSDPSLAVLGGRVLPYHKNDSGIGIRTYEKRIRFTAPRQLLKLIIGCNMAFTRKVFDEIRGFDPGLGAGSRCRSAEDSDFVYRAYKKGFKIVYSPEIVVYHNHGRQSEDEIRSLREGYVLGRGAFYCKHILRGDRAILKLTVREIYRRTLRLLKNYIAGETTVSQAALLRALVKGLFCRSILS
jgi:GT2 family glycosyltransferase